MLLQDFSSNKIYLNTITASSTAGQIKKAFTFTRRV